MPAERFCPPYNWAALQLGKGTSFPSVMRGNASRALRHKRAGRGMADIAQAENADHALGLVDHRQSPHLQTLHMLHRLGEIVVVAAAMDTGGHHLACGRLARIEAVL